MLVMVQNLHICKAGKVHSWTQVCTELVMLEQWPVWSGPLRSVLELQVSYKNMFKDVLIWVVLSTLNCCILVSRFCFRLFCGTILSCEARMPCWTTDLWTLNIISGTMGMVWWITRTLPWPCPGILFLMREICKGIFVGRYRNVGSNCLFVRIMSNGMHSFAFPEQYTTSRVMWGRRVVEDGEDKISVLWYVWTCCCAFSWIYYLWN